MTPELRSAFHERLLAARTHFQMKNFVAAFSELETAHILGQQYLLPHVTVHLWMLRVGIARSDKREIIGQINRLAATVPAFIFGWVPVGNTGGANVSAFKPMSVPQTLKNLIPSRNRLQVISVRIALAATVVLAWRLF
ncbi:MAG: DUF3703 domain-containing protein [Hyphomonas sp.]|uniref:DUF3703 domain-containing protein n=1 Tax=Hyphomonas sp. TaxID=87 RepID=UPI0005F1352E|nr:DUF3703 domain-containing protein [Hyphomonas sp.]KJS28051.1 MAG: hypothetical protein VR75_00770 [Hyphomonadaceae bacterium BRH_c29]MBU3919081.1 DUF3703 domain-containing protein [Alphaproteobacteria bacterium]MBA3070188.1 DUF3703 domain-containing protein [Hyphomonas sp.]MBU4060236.1 DUF3703 domain-containing protein [Alphaproteobacteria bacterium]MBU4162904.1 DUF3703 domain-containing protein [Alphaproteobacteria bacterium]